MPSHAGLPSPPGPPERVTEGNRVEHLPDDNRSVRRIWEALEGAEQRVWMSMYILNPGKVGTGTLQRLADAARRGCEVLLLYDGVGSITLRAHHLAPLRRAGGQVAVFNRVWPPWRKTGSLRIRNHRKLILIDNRIGFCGGQNLSQEFAGRHYGEDWTFDGSMTYVEGPCVGDLADVFLRTWHEVTGMHRELPSRAEPFADGVTVEVIETDPRRGETRLIEVVRAAVERARERCYMSSPYFIPASWLKEVLLDASRRGVDVRIVTAGDSDVALALAAGRACYGPLLDGGVRIYEMYGRTLHAKTLMVDGFLGSVGSYNFDLWTSRHVLDVAVAVADQTYAGAVRQEFETFLEQAKEISLEAWQERSPLRKAYQRAAFCLSERL